MKKTAQTTQYQTLRKQILETASKAFFGVPIKEISFRFYTRKKNYKAVVMYRRGNGEPGEYVSASGTTKLSTLTLLQQTLRKRKALAKQWKKTFIEAGKSNKVKKAIRSMDSMGKRLLGSK